MTRRPARCDVDQRRREQADLADPWMRQQQLAQHPARPAAARQLGVEPGKAAGDGLGTAAAELVTEPQGGMEGFRRPSKGVRIKRRRVPSSQASPPAVGDELAHADTGLRRPG